MFYEVFTLNYILLKHIYNFIICFFVFVSILNYTLLKQLSVSISEKGNFVSILKYIFLKPQKVVLEIIRLQGYVIYNQYEYKTFIYLYYI